MGEARVQQGRRREGAVATAEKECQRRVLAGRRLAVARAAGIRESYWVRDEAHFEQLIDRRLDEGGPLFLAAKIDDKPGAAQPPRDPALVKSRFMKALGTSRGGPLDA